MANPVQQSKSYTSESEQEILKKSRDDKYNVLATMLLGEDGSTARRVKVDSSGGLIAGSQLPTDGENSSMLISKNAAGEAVYVDETISGVTYRQTFTRGDMVIDSTLPISAVEII